LEDHVVPLGTGSPPHVQLTFSASARPEAQELATGSMFGLVLAVAAIVASFNARKVGLFVHSVRDGSLFQSARAGPVDETDEHTAHVRSFLKQRK